MSGPAATGGRRRPLTVVAISIGNEILDGRTTDSNLGFAARTLGAAGLRIARHATIGDDRAGIRAALERELAAGADVILLSGGLGPTADDVTRDALADLAGVRLIEDPAVRERLAARYARVGRAFTGVARRQALLPEGVEQLPNPVGLAPGLWLEREGRAVAAMPGVPAEYQAILGESVLPRLRRLAGPEMTRSVALRTMGVPEAELADRIAALSIDWTGIELAYLPHPGGVDLRLVITGGSEVESKLATAVAALAERFGDDVYARGEMAIEEVVGGMLRARGLHVAVAESCTGGMLGARLTRVPGSSDYFRGGVVAYANEAKIALLGVPPALLAAKGAVSEEVALAMANGARAKLDAEVALAITGIAGPGGGTEEKPVGLVYLAFAGQAKAVARRLFLPASRELIRERATLLALDLLRRELAAASG
jgi:nicotinamide-nucleotide amidase